MIILEDNGEKKEIEYEVEINDRLSENSYAILVPVIKEEFYLGTGYIDNYGFSFEYTEADGIFSWWIILFVIPILLITIIICLAICVIRRRRRKNNDDLSEKIVSNDLQPIEASD